MGRNSDGDIIDVMMGWIGDIFGWLLGILIAAAFGLIKFIFKFIAGGVKSIFKSNEDDQVAE